MNSLVREAAFLQGYMDKNASLGRWIKGGALAGGALGLANSELTNTEDEETTAEANKRRLKAAIIPALVGGGAGALAGLYGKDVDSRVNASLRPVNDSLNTLMAESINNRSNSLDNASQIVQQLKERIKGVPLQESLGGARENFNNIFNNRGF